MVRSWEKNTQDGLLDCVECTKELFYNKYESTIVKISHVIQSWRERVERGIRPGHGEHEFFGKKSHPWVKYEIKKKLLTWCTTDCEDRLILSSPDKEERNFFPWGKMILSHHFKKKERSSFLSPDEGNLVFLSSRKTEKRSRSQVSTLILNFWWSRSQSVSSLKITLLTLNSSEWMSQKWIDFYFPRIDSRSWSLSNFEKIFGVDSQVTISLFQCPRIENLCVILFITSPRVF